VSTPATPVTDDRLTPAQAVAGFLAAAAMFVAAITVLNIDFTINGVSIAFRPVKAGVAAELVALVAVALGGGRTRLPAFAAAFCTFCWFAAMVVAVITHRPLF
jgi:hypothetical protein